MRLRLRTRCLRFTYTFPSGYQLVGRVEGDCFRRSPEIIFNLRSLNAVCLSPQGSPVMYFNEGFGQLNLTSSEIILSGSQAHQLFHQASFFSINYRDAEATIYDIKTDQWIATGWEPDNWHISDQLEMPLSMMRQSLVTPTMWSNQAIA